jgi:hypothetical protein
MAKGESNEGWWLGALFAGAAVAFLYYSQTGFGKENDSALIPNTLEGKIDRLITVLNTRFGKGWVGIGAAVLKYSLQSALPEPLVTLVDVVVAVENESKRRRMTGPQKQQLAVRMIRSSKG